MKKILLTSITAILSHCASAQVGINANNTSDWINTNAATLKSSRESNPAKTYFITDAVSTGAFRYAGTAQNPSQDDGVMNIVTADGKMYTRILFDGKVHAEYFGVSSTAPASVNTIALR